MSELLHRHTLRELRHFLEEGWPPAARSDAERGGAIPEEVYAELGRCGLFALSIAREHGGLGIEVRARLATHALVARHSASLQSVLIVHEMVADAIQRFAGPAVKGRWLRHMASGQCVGAFALTEPQSSSSFDGIRSHMRETADGHRIDGTKSWVSSGLRAGVFLTFATSAHGSTALLVGRDSAGVHVSPAPPLGAFNATSMATVTFSDCAVSVDDQLGRGGLGLLRVGSVCLTLGRLCVAAGALSIGHAALTAAIEHARQRLVGQTPLADRDLVKKIIADAYVRLRAGGLLVREAAAAFDSGQPSAMNQAIAAKLFADEAVRLTTTDALRLFGAAGLTADSVVRRYAAEAQVYNLIEGSSEVLACALGSDILRSGSDLTEILECES